MKLTVLGSGTSVPHASRSAPAFWLDTLAGSLLLDIGPDTTHRMAEERLDWPNLDAIWVSHFHLDHFGGLAPFLSSMKWAPQTRTRTKTLRIAGPGGLRNLLDSINDANNYRLFAQPFKIEVFEIKPAAPFELLPGLAATTMKTPHTKESLALHLKDLDNKTLVYTGDTGYAEELAEFARNVNLLLMECSFTRNKPLHTHLELAEATSLGQTSNPETLVLTHLYPEWDGIDVVHEAKSYCSCKIIEARDGLEIKI
jgi:ribonuclease BN (tRNA processing enzyme)